MSKVQTAIAPIVKTVEVARPPDEAFRLFTQEMARWWPLATHSVGGQDAVWCGIEPRVGGRVYERTGDGTEHVWGGVRLWQPPQCIVFTWHPGQPSDPHTEVEIRFDAVADDRCRVVLEHRNWQAIGDRASAVHANYASGWDLVFVERFGTHAT